MKVIKSLAPVLTVLASIFFLALGILAIWFGQKHLNLEGQGMYISLLVVPIIIYAIISGKLSEIKAGGLEAKFATVAKRPVDVGSQKIVYSEAGEVEKSSVPELTKQMKALDKSKPFFLSLEVGKWKYSGNALRKYVEELSEFPTFKFVVIVNSERKFVACFPAQTILKITKKQQLLEELEVSLNHEDPHRSTMHPGAITETLSADSTNHDALVKMTSQRLEAMIVLDKERRVNGIVERDQVVGKLLAAIAS